MCLYNRSKRKLEEMREAMKRMDVSSEEQKKAKEKLAVLEKEVLYQWGLWYVLETSCYISDNILGYFFSWTYFANPFACTL